MITATDIRAAFVDLIKNKAKIPYDIYFNRVTKSDTSYVWVELSMRKGSWDEAYFQRIISADIHVVPFPNDYAEVKYVNLWEVSDSLTKAIMPYIKVKDRFITIYDFNSQIVDDVLHYEFEMNFTDYVQSDKYEEVGYDFMENLELDF